MDSSNKCVEFLLIAIVKFTEFSYIICRLEPTEKIEMPLILELALLQLDH